MEQEDNTPIWEGPLGNTGYTTRIEPVGKNMHRGILKIIDGENNTQYQIEVKIDRMSPQGGNQTHVGEWNRIIQNWAENNL
jgi:hypothetical protein